jgi:multidrug efflux pump
VNFSRLFILRPVATLILSAAILILGSVAYRFLPVAPLPQMDIPTIIVRASLAGASPETMAATVATPLERAMGQIAGISELTSTSSQGSTSVIIQFDLSRDIDGAARDVQAAINSARTLLPSAMKTLPRYRKLNPSAAPIVMLALTSDTLNRGELYDLASSKLQQRIAQLEGVGEVQIRGGALPAVRIDLRPKLIESYGIALDTIRSRVEAATTNSPRGLLQTDETAWWIEANGQLTRAADYRNIVIAYKGGRPVYLKDIANVYDSVQNIYSAGYFNSVPSVSVSITQAMGANMLKTIERIKEIIPQLNELLPAGTKLTLAIDRSLTIQESLNETVRTLLFSVMLVIAVVYVFLRDRKTVLIPALALPISLVGTFGVMYLLGFSLDALSMMALIISTGFVVDDAIVVVENIKRHVEEGLPPMQAALKGSAEIGFTVFSMTASLIAVFIPLLLMPGLAGRLFKEFAITLSVALIVSMWVSLTLTPMLSARLLGRENDKAPAVRRRWPQTIAMDALISGQGRLHDLYVKSLSVVMRHKPLTMLILLLTVAGNFYLYATVDKGLFPNQDNGMLFGRIRADLRTSFTSMEPQVRAVSARLEKDPAIRYVLASTGGSGFGSRNSGNLFIRLKDIKDRKETATQVANRLTAQNANTPGLQIFLMAAQDLRVGGRSSNSTYQYSLQSDNLETLRAWNVKVHAAMAALPELTSVDSDAESGGLEAKVIIDRDAASRYGLDAQDIDTFLNNAFSQRQIATQYQMLNQYYSIIGFEQSWTQDPEVLTRLNVITPDGKAVPVSNFAKLTYTSAPLSVAHQDQTATTTIAFNLADGVSLDQAKAAIERAMVSIGLPSSIHGSLQGTGKVFDQIVGQIPLLIGAAIAVIYILLGILYESWIHPVTILSTLPSAGIGALLLMMATGTELTVIALIGILLLIGIVKKNAILMIDFALVEERSGASPEQAILKACDKRFRPIIMTTLAAFFGALPLILQSGGNAEFNRPLGIAICGGLAVSQILTLYTTPVVYVYLDRFGSWVKRYWQKISPAAAVARRAAAQQANEA